MIEIDLKDAIDNLLVYIECDQMNACREYLEVKMTEAKLREFSLDFLIALERHEMTLEDNHGHNKFINNPGWIVQYNDSYILLDGNHRVNSIIQKNIEGSSHYFIDLSDMPFCLNI